MTRDKALEYQDMRVRVEYDTKVGPHKRSGTITNISLRKLILLAFNGEDELFEFYIPLKCISRIYELKPKNEETHKSISKAL